MPTPATTDSTLQHELANAVKLVLTAGGGLLAAYLKKLFDDRKARLLKKKQSDPLYLAEKQLQLDQFITRALLELEADHASIYKFHNGEHYAGGDSIQKMSLASEDVRTPVFARFKTEAQGIHTSLFPAMMRGVGTQPSYWLQSGECEDYAANEVLSRRGYHTTAAVLIRGKGNQWLGLLALSWTATHQPTPEDAVFLHALQVELGFLMNP